MINPNNGLNPSEKQELASAYYFKLSELRIDYLKQFKAERNKNANLKATMDYIGHLSSNTPAVTTFYSSYNENLSSAAAGTVILEQQFRDNMADSLLKTTEADVDTIENVELQFVSKETAIDMINKHIGFYEKDNNQRKPEIDESKLGNDVIKSLLDASSGTSWCPPYWFGKKNYSGDNTMPSLSSTRQEATKARAGTIHTYEEYYRGVSL